MESECRAGWTYAVCNMPVKRCSFFSEESLEELNSYICFQFA